MALFILAIKAANDIQQPKPSINVKPRAKTPLLMLLPLISPHSNGFSSFIQRKLPRL